MKMPFLNSVFLYDIHLGWFSWKFVYIGLIDWNPALVRIMVFALNRQQTISLTNDGIVCRCIHVTFSPKDADSWTILNLGPDSIYSWYLTSIGYPILGIPLSYLHNGISYTQLNSTQKCLYVICKNIHTITLGVWNPWRVCLTPLIFSI